MRRNHGIPMAMAVLLTFVLISTSRAATVSFFTDESAWLAAVENVEIFSVTSANVATADEVTSPPVDFDALGDILTFRPVNTGLSRTFILETLEPSADIVFRNGSYGDELSIGAHEVHEDDDWQMTFTSGPALYGFAFDLIGNQDPGVGDEELFSVHGLDDSLLDTDSPPTWPGVYGFYGVVSDVPIGRIEFDEDTGPDDIDLAEFRFGGTTAIPIPGAVWLLGSGLIGLVGIRGKLKWKQ
ncbi:MAG: VPLPA-CTERM sorting domain-containing protein [Thermodesulfobacteriota bacterium]|nr:VPLPA-CTERM sorting domain-containing protein [Thermodesulfobacteriota bacterium]